MFNADVRRPMADGVLNPREKMAMPVLEAILQDLCPRRSAQGEILAFSVPAAIDGKEAELTYHEATLRRHFESMGYKAVAINEGLAVIFSELEDENFTGIGISCGGGMCNVTLAYLSIPSIMFSITKGGDFIDQLGGRGGERARHPREGHQGRGARPEPRAPRTSSRRRSTSTTRTWWSRWWRRCASARSRRAEKLPKTDRPLPIVLSGGTAKPKGFKDLFERPSRTARSRSRSPGCAWPRTR